MQVGASLIQEVAGQSDKGAGDGTTTSTLLAAVLVNAGTRAVTSGVSPMPLKVGMERAGKALVKCLEERARPVEGVEDILALATISSGSPVMGGLISRAFDRVGDTGSVVLEESQTLNDQLDFTEGFSIDRGYLSRAFISDPERMLCEQNDVKILVTDIKISTTEELLPILEEVVKNSWKVR